MMTLCTGLQLAFSICQFFLPFPTCSFKGQVKSHLLEPRASQSTPSRCPQLLPFLMRYQRVHKQAECQKEWTITSPPNRPTFWVWALLCRALTRLAQHLPSTGQTPTWACFTEMQGRVAPNLCPSSAQAIISRLGTTITTLSAHTDCFLPSSPSLELPGPSEEPLSQQTSQPEPGNEKVAGN